MKKFMTALVAVVFAFTIAAPAANAATYYSNYQYTSQSQEETIANLQRIVDQLIAQLNARGFQTNIQYQYQTPMTYRNYGQYRSSQVRQNNKKYNYTNYGYYNNYNNAEVEVETRYASYSNGDVDLYGAVDLNRADYAYVWFEYGDDSDMDEDTSQKKVTRDGTFHAAIDVDDLRDDEVYYFRAVAKDDEGDYDYGVTRSFYVSDGGSSSRNDDEPDATTNSAQDVRDDEAELRGEVDMNDFNNGYVFFVYGEDEDQIDDVDRENEYRDIDEDGDDLQKVAVDSDLDGSRSYYRTVTGLDDNTDHYFRICVEYEDEDDDPVLECGSVRHFETD